MALNISNLVTGLSTASDTTVPTPQGSPNRTVLTLSDLAGPSAPPQAIIRDTPSIQALRFPLDTPMYYMTISLHAYSRQNWREVGELSQGTTIVLPIPPQLVDAQHVMYEVVDLGTIGGLSMQALGNVVKGSENKIASAMADIQSHGGGIAARTLAEIARLGVGSGVVNSGLIAAGLAVNDFLTVMLRGPTYKKHEFTWKFNPRNAAESEMLRKIYVTLMDAQAPGIPSGSWYSSAFFSYPDIAKIAFKYGDGSRNIQDTLFYFKPCVIEHCVFSFAPNGSPGFYATSKAPESVELKLSFMELELWLKGDYASAQGGGRVTNPFNFSTPATTPSSVPNIFDPNRTTPFNVGGGTR